MVEVLPVETPTLGGRSYLAHDGGTALVMGPANTAGSAGPDLSPPRRADAAEICRAIQAGYTSCPLVTSRNRMMLAEFSDLKRTLKPRYDIWLLERYGLPSLYWNLMLKGLA